MKPASIILIGGPSGSGKSTFANGLADYLTQNDNPSAVVSLDSYYRDLSHLTPEQRAAYDFDQPEAWEHEKILEHAKRLRQGHPVELPAYNFSSHCRTRETITFHPEYSPPRRALCPPLPGPQ